MFEKICYFESTCKTIKMQNSPTESKPEKVNDNIKITQRFESHLLWM